MGKISEKKANHLKDKIKQEFPDLKILFKSEYEKWPDHILLRFIKLFVSIVRFFSPSFKEKFNHHFANGFGKFLILPNREWLDWTNPKYYEVVRHEFVHMVDYKNNPVWFILTYILLPLPTLFSGRAYWEMRAFTQNMIVEYERKGGIKDRKLEWITKYFTSGTYFWMFPFKCLVKKKLKDIRKKIESGEIQGLYID